MQGPRKGRSFVFDRHDTFIFGRSRNVHCSVPEDSALSRDHFLIEVRPPLCELRDLGSTNGTFVNDRRVRDRIRLKQGDRILAGSSLFNVRVEGVPEVPVGQMTPWPGGTTEYDRARTRRQTNRLRRFGAYAPPTIEIARDGGPSAATWSSGSATSAAPRSPLRRKRSRSTRRFAKSAEARWEWFISPATIRAAGKSRSS